MTETSLPAAAERIEIFDNAEDRFYELRANGVSAGLLVYEPSGSRRVLTHTTIKEPYRGRGLGNRLIRFALDDLREKHIVVTNYCSAVDRFIQANRDYEALIDDAHPGTWPKRGSEADATPRS